MKDIQTIILRLTLSCLLAGSVMGGTYIFTKNAKTHNEHVTEQRVRLALLGYNKENPAPESLALHTMYRYIVTSADQQSIAYLLPTKEGAKSHFILTLIDLAGKFQEAIDVELKEAELEDAGIRDAAVQAALGTGRQMRLADHTVIATDNGKRIAYLLGGKFPGFKTFIGVMLAIDPKFSVMGLEILEHEEDPGLGAEIEQDYFRNQFKEKPFDVLKTLKVVKKPLPADYQKALEGKVDEEAAAKLITNYRDKDIYAITGATISSDAVNDGVKAIVRKFVYRVNILDQVVKQQKLPVAF